MERRRRKVDETMSWKIVLRPNFDSEDKSNSGTCKIVARDYPTQESAIAAEQGIAAGGRWWGKAVASVDVAEYVKSLVSAGHVLVS